MGAARLAALRLLFGKSCRLLVLGGIIFALRGLRRRWRLYRGSVHGLLILGLICLELCLGSRAAGATGTVIGFLLGFSRRLLCVSGNGFEGGCLFERGLRGLVLGGLRLRGLVLGLTGGGIPLRGELRGGQGSGGGALGLDICLGLAAAAMRSQRGIDQRCGVERGGRSVAIRGTGGCEHLCGALLHTALAAYHRRLGNLGKGAGLGNLCRRGLLWGGLRLGGLGLATAARLGRLLHLLLYRFGLAATATELWSFLCRLRRIVRLRSCGIGNRSIALVLLSGFGTSSPGLARGLLGSGLFTCRLRCGRRALCRRGLLCRRGHRIPSGLHLRHTSRCGRGSLNLLASFNLAGRRCGRLHGLGLVIV